VSKVDDPSGAQEPFIKSQLASRNLPHAKLAFDEKLRSCSAIEKASLAKEGDSGTFRFKQAGSLKLSFNRS
jgi:hypothetical protein